MNKEAKNTTSSNKNSKKPAMWRLFSRLSMKKVAFLFIDAIDGGAVYLYTDKYGNEWMAHRKYGFRCRRNTDNKNISNSLCFKEQLEQEFIPAITRMAEKERKHLEWLQKHDQSNRQIYMFTLRSACVLKHLEERLQEYTQYAKSL